MWTRSSSKTYKLRDGGFSIGRHSARVASTPVRHARSPSAPLCRRQRRDARLRARRGRAWQRTPCAGRSDGEGFEARSHCDRTGDRLFQTGILRGNAGGRGDLHKARQSRRFLANLRQSELCGRRPVQARQRPLPQILGLLALLDPCLGRARPPLQCPRLPELPSEGWARPPAGTGGDGGLHVPAPLGPAKDGGGARKARLEGVYPHPRADLWRPASEFRRSRR